MTQADIEVLKEQVAELSDRLNNGVKYREETNEYILVWTKREIKKARKKAKKLRKKLGW